MRKLLNETSLAPARLRLQARAVLDS